MSSQSTADQPTETVLRTEQRQDDVTVKKKLVRASPSLVNVWLRLAGRGSRERGVTVAESLPEPIDHADVGLHPEYGQANWTRTTDGLEFATTVGAEATVTMYGVRDVDVVPASLAAPPTVVDSLVQDRSSR